MAYISFVSFHFTQMVQKLIITDKRLSEICKLRTVFVAKFGMIPYKSGMMRKLGMLLLLLYGQTYVNKCKL